MNEKENLLKSLLNQHFNESAIQEVIGAFLIESKESKKWMLYSDYCLDDKNKPNDVITFVLMPFIDEEHYAEMQKTIATLQPADIKQCDFISQFNGGQGAVREVCDLIRDSKNH